MGFAKVSTLILYARIFPLQNLNWILWILALIFVANSVIPILITILQCSPVKGAWDPFVQAKCINIMTIFMALNIVNVVTDVILVAMPLPHLWRLQMPRSTRIELVGIFSVGIL